MIIRSTSIAAEAQLILEQFNARGIACWISRQQAPHLIGYSTEQPAESSVTVWSEDETAARELLDRLMQHECEYWRRFVRITAARCNHRFSNRGGRRAGEAAAKP